MRQLSQEIENNPGHSAEILTLDSPVAPWLQSLPVAHHALGPTWGKYGFTPQLLPWLREHGASYDAVIVNGIWQYHGNAVWRALRNTGTPYFVFPHGMLDPWFGRRYRSKHLKKWLYWLCAEYWILRDAAAVVFTTDEESQLARQSFWLHRWHEHVVNFGTAPPPDQPEMQRESFYAKFPGLRGRPFLLFLGRLHEKKGCDLLLKAFAHVRQSCSEAGQVLPDLVLAGPCADPIFLERLKTLANRLGFAADDSSASTSPNPLDPGDILPGRLHFLPMLAGDAKWGAFRSAQAFILPSHQENFGMAVAEALACGTPVLISDKVNIWREIKSDGAGLVEADTTEGCIKMITSWIRIPTDVREAMRERARFCFESRFDIRIASKALMEVLGDHRLPGGAEQAVPAEGTG